MKVRVSVLVEKGMGALNPVFGEVLEVKTTHTSELVDAIRNTFEDYQQYPFTITRVEEIKKVTYKKKEVK